MNKLASLQTPMSDNNSQHREQAQDLQSLTQIVRSIDIDDPKREGNKTYMRDSKGRMIQFNEW